MDRPRPDRPRPTPDKSAPDNVIALSRYRAQLGRGRKLRRADALLSGPDPERAIHALPGDEFYYVIHEIGLGEAGDILVHGRPEQIQAALDFALWERDQVIPERLYEWTEALAEAPYERLGVWLAGLDVELLALILRKTARIYDLTQEEPPDEPEGVFYATPDGFFLLDVRGTGEPGSDGAAGLSEPTSRAVIRLMDGFYRANMNLARRILVGARAELDTELEEMAFRWREGRMSDLGFADYYEALEVYRELDPASVRIGEVDPALARARPADAGAGAETPARMPTALVDHVTGGGTPFARAVQAVTAPDEIANLHDAMVALTNRVLAADRVEPGDDPAVIAEMERMTSTLDIAIEFLARGDDLAARDAVRTIPLQRLFRLGVSLVGKVRHLAHTLRRKGPFASLGRDLGEPEGAAVMESVTRVRPMFPSVLDHPPTTGERPFRSLIDIARVTAVIEREATAQAMLVGLGVTPTDVAHGWDDTPLDVGMLARTVLVRRLLGSGSSSSGDVPSMTFRPLEPRELREYEARLEATHDGAMKLPENLKKKVRAILDAVSPGRLAGAAAEVADRWIAGLAPLEPVLVRRSPRRPRRR